MKKRFEWLIVFMIGVLSISIVEATPVGPGSVNVLSNGRYGLSGAGANVTAIAGNVTQMVFNATSITQTWQGYYGNITGMIVLGNSNNQSMYNWNLTSPAGQIYATRVASVPAWTSIQCATPSAIETEDTNIGANSAVDADSTNNTFTNATSFSAFYVGNININSSQNCRAIHLFDSAGAPSASFSEVVLSDTADIIYTGLITSPTSGFDSASHQFEMIVGENGHLGDTAATPYYFYVELN